MRLTLNYLVYVFQIYEQLGLDDSQPVKAL